MTLTRLAILAFVLLSPFASSWALNPDTANLARYAADNERVKDEGKTVDVIFMGNSITDHWVGFHPEFFSDNNYLDRGIGGQTSSQMLLRFRQDVIDLAPRVVVINAGTNDCAENTGRFDADFTFGNIVSMTDLARANGIRVILASVLPASGFGWNRNITDAAERIDSLNSRIRAYAEANNIPYADYYSAMVAGPDKALNPEYTEDGVHPNAGGYTLMENIVNPIIVKTLNK